MKTFVTSAALIAALIPASAAVLTFGETHQEVSASAYATEMAPPFTVIAQDATSKFIDTATNWKESASAGVDGLSENPPYLANSKAQLTSTFSSFGIEAAGKAEAFTDGFGQTFAYANGRVQMSVQFTVDAPTGFSAAGTSKWDQNAGLATDYALSTLSIVGGPSLFSKSFLNDSFTANGQLAPGNVYRWTIDLATGGGGDGLPFSSSLRISAVPEPATTAAAVAAGCLIFAIVRRRRAS